MSDDPSPWADLSGASDDAELAMTTAEMIREFVLNRAQEEGLRIQETRLWDRFANRLTRDGTVIR